MTVTGGPGGVTAVFEGGGVKAIGLAGAVAAALDQGMTFDTAIGTSAGAIVAALLAAGYGSDELRSAVETTDWPQFMDLDRSPLDFDLTPIQALELFDAGYRQATNVLVMA